MDLLISEGRNFQCGMNGGKGLRGCCPHPRPPLDREAGKAGRGKTRLADSLVSLRSTGRVESWLLQGHGCRRATWTRSWCKTARLEQRAPLKRSHRSKKSVCLTLGNEARSSPRCNYRPGELRRCRVGEVNGDVCI